MKAAQHFANSPGSVKEARRFVEEQISTSASDVTLAASLMVSELATNCIRHANSGFTITMNMDNELLHVTVTDDGGGVPIVRSPSVTEPTGRGLRIVSELSDDWGTSSVNGTSVWFSLRLVDGARSAEGSSSTQDLATSQPAPTQMTTSPVGLESESNDTNGEQPSRRPADERPVYRPDSLGQYSADHICVGHIEFARRVVHDGGHCCARSAQARGAQRSRQMMWRCARPVAAR